MDDIHCLMIGASGVGKTVFFLYPTRYDGNNMLHLVNQYMDTYRADEKNIVVKAKAEKYAKIIAKTIINAGGENFGQNQFFYDAAEGLLTAVING